MSGVSRLLLILAGAALIVTGCVTAVSPSPTTTSASPTPDPRSTASSHVLPSATALALPEPGRPYDAGDILDAMRDSRRPGGVPDDIETEPIAAAVAEAILTIGAEPWDAMAVGGACGPSACTLDVTGTRAGREEADTWTFAITRDGSVETVTADLHILPLELPATLDALARAAAPFELDGLVLASTRWVRPPAEGRYVLAYRLGDEEGSCERDVTLDAAGTLLDIASRDC